MHMNIRHIPMPLIIYIFIIMDFELYILSPPADTFLCYHLKLLMCGILLQVLLLVKDFF